MIRRCPKDVAVLAAVLALGYGFQLSPALADPINPNANPATATYRLTSTTTLPAPDAQIEGPQVVAMVLPAGSVVPPKLADGSEGSPLTVLPDSHGFDPDQLVVALKDGMNSQGQAEQYFGLIFFGQGLQPGGELHFALSIDKALASNPPILNVLTPGVSIVGPLPTAVPPTDSPPESPPGGSEPMEPPIQIPEPLSILLWSAVAAGVVVRRGLLRVSRS